MELWRAIIVLIVLPLIGLGLLALALEWDEHWLEVEIERIKRKPDKDC